MRVFQASRGQTVRFARAATAKAAAATAPACPVRYNALAPPRLARTTQQQQQHVGGGVADSGLSPLLHSSSTIATHRRQQQHTQSRGGHPRRRVVAAAGGAANAAAKDDNEADEADEDGEEGEAGEGEWDEWEGDEDEWVGEGEGEGEDEEGEEEDEGEGDGSGQQRQGEAAAASGPPPIPEDARTTPYVEGAFVEVGRIARAHGVRGELRVALLTDAPKKRFACGKRLWLQPPQPRGALGRAAAARSSGGGAPAGQQQQKQQRQQNPQQQNPQLQLRRVTVEAGRMLKADAKGRPGSGAWGVKLAEVSDRTAAEALAGHTLLLAVCDRERRAGGRDDFFVSDLVGMRVHDRSTTALVGLVTEVYDVTGPTATLRVRLAPSRDDIAASVMRLALVPFAREIVPVVDVAGRRMELAAPEGLLVAATKRKLRRKYTPEQAAALLAQLEAEEARVRGVVAAAAAAAGQGDGK